MDGRTDGQMTLRALIIDCCHFKETN